MPRVKNISFIILILILVFLWDIPHILSIDKKLNGILRGVVIFTGVPCPPQKKIVPPCEGPYPDYEVVLYMEDGKTEFARTMTDINGNYWMEMPEGKYIVYLMRFDPFLKKPKNVPQTIQIKAGKILQLDLYIDTGIR